MMISKKNMKPRIKIFGAGIGGLTAAHFLADYGNIEVYEMKDIAGGLAKSHGPKCNTHEISWRVYFHFYKHIMGIMKNISSSDGKSVFDHLIPYINIFVPDEPFLNLMSVSQIWKIFILLTSGLKRLDDYDHMPWRDYINSDFAEIPQWLGLDRFKGSTTSVHKIGIEQSGIQGQNKIDYVLDGPTNDVWINPWVKNLQKRGVKFYFNSKVKRVIIDHKKNVNRVHMNNGVILQADIYILALPIESIAIVSPELVPNSSLLSKKGHQIQLAFQMHLEKPLSLGYKNGKKVQSFLLRNSPWSLIVESKTISWGEKYTKDCLTQWSATVCQSDVPGILTKKTLSESTEKEATIEILAQLESSKDLMTILQRENRNFDGKLRVIKWATMNETYMFGPPLKVDEPKFSNNATTKIIRPSVYLGPNVYLSTAYTKEALDIFSMEGAAISGKTVAAMILGKDKPVYPERPYPALNILRWTDDFLFMIGAPNIIITIIYLIMFYYIYKSIYMRK